MCGNWAQDATKSHTRSEDAQDALDANLTSLASVCKVDAWDATKIFADVGQCYHLLYSTRLYSTMLYCVLYDTFMYDTLLYCLNITTSTFACLLG